MSINGMVRRLAGLVDTRDVSAWENAFIKSLLQQTDQGNNTTSITEKQLTVMERLFAKYFGD